MTEFNYPKDTDGSRGHKINDSYIPSVDIVVVRQGSHNTLPVNRWLFVKTAQEMIVQAIPLEP